MEVNKKAYTYAGVGGLSLLVLGILATQVVPRAIVNFAKAAPGKNVSLNNSSIIAGKILCVADGKDQCFVNVFLLDPFNKGVAGKAVSLTGIETAVPKSGISDGDGKVTFKMTSTTEGQFTLKPVVDGNVMSKEIKVTFRN